MRRLGFASLLASRSSRPRELVLALVAARILEPESKLATTRRFTSLPTTLGVADAQLYTAMDWLLQRQDRIEHKLAARHLHNDGLALYDLSSSYFEGLRCPLASLGHNRDGKKGKLQVNYGLLTNARGLPVSVSVFKGNTADPTTLLPEVNKLRSDFGMQRIVLVGDRGMITQKQVDALREIDGIDWIAALRPEAIKKLIQGGQVQRGLFDERNLFELTHADFPGERLVACRNPELARRRADKRQSLLEATGGELERVRRMVERGRLRGQEQIGKAVQRVLNQYKIGKCYRVEIRNDGFEVQVDPDQLTADAVRSYKLLSQVERAFRSFKTLDLEVRPIYHHLERRVRAHIFLCLLAYYVQWHMLEAWRPLLFSDEDLEAKTTRDPVAPARRSEAAEHKALSRTLEDGSQVHSFRTLLKLLSGIVKNICRIPAAGPDAPTFEVVTTPNPKQQSALDLLKTIQL